MAAPSAESALGNSLAIGLLVMLVAVLGIAGTYFALRVRRWMRSEESYDPFTLQDLREMRARGEISPREFETLRAEIIGSVGGRVGPEVAGGDPHDWLPPEADDSAGDGR